MPARLWVGWMPLWLGWAPLWPGWIQPRPGTMQPRPGGVQLCPRTMLLCPRKIEPWLGRNYDLALSSSPLSLLRVPVAAEWRIQRAGWLGSENAVLVGWLVSFVVGCRHYSSEHIKPCEGINKNVCAIIQLNLLDRIGLDWIGNRRLKHILQMAHPDSRLPVCLSAPLSWWQQV